MNTLDEWDWFALIGYALVTLAFMATLETSIVHVMRQRHGLAYASERRFKYGFIALLIAACWPISLPIAVLLATVSIMAGRKR